MFSSRAIAVVGACVLLNCASDAFAFDGQRQGFILGIGAGPGLTSFTQTLDLGSWPGGGSETTDRENKFGLQTDFKIGYAPSNTFQVYYSNKVSWFGIENALGEDVIITSGVMGVGASYYLSPEAPSLFFGGGLGVSVWNAPFEDGSEAWTGFGLYTWAGYEFSRHWNVELDVVWGKPSKQESGIEASANALSLMFKVDVLGY